MTEAEILAELPLATPARGLAWDGEALRATLPEGRRLVRLDPSTGSETSSFDLPSGEDPTGLAWTLRGEAPALWQAMAGAGSVVELDPDTGAERRRLEVAEDGRGLRGLCTDGAAGPTIWFVEGPQGDSDSGARAGRFDARDGEVHKRLALDPDASGIDWDGRWLWIARYERRRLVRIDPMFADATHVLELDFSPSGIAFDGEALWAADRDAPRLIRIGWPGLDG